MAKKYVYSEETISALMVIAFMLEAEGNNIKANAPMMEAAEVNKMSTFDNVKSWQIILTFANLINAYMSQSK